MQPSDGLVRHTVSVLLPDDPDIFPHLWNMIAKMDASNHHSLLISNGYIHMYDDCKDGRVNR